MQLVSVIIPAYNPQNFLLETVRSVFNQTHQNIEVILVNDGSCAEYTPLFENISGLYPQLRLLSLPQNKGVAGARNIGVNAARGEYLSFLDQDDMWDFEKLALQSQHLDNYSEIDYVTSRQRYFLSEGVVAPPAWMKSAHLDTSLPGFLPGTLMVRAEIFRLSNGFDESLKAGTDDVDWFFRANNMGLKTFELPQQLLLKRIHGKNLSAQVVAHNKELLSVVRMNMLRKKNQETVNE